MFNLKMEMSYIVARLSELSSKVKCELKVRQHSNKYFIKLSFPSGSTYGLSYVFKKRQFMLWDNYGEFYDYCDQIRVTFKTSDEVISFIRKYDVDAVFDYYKKNNIHDLVWSNYDPYEFEEKYGEVIDVQVKQAKNCQ